MLKSKFSIAAFFVFFNACNSQSQVKTNRSRAVIIENCKSLSKIKNGDTLLVKLEEYPGRGYSWQIKKVPDLNDGIRFLAKTSDPGSPETREGSSKTVMFKFLMLKKTKYLLEFEYLRPWEKEKPPLETCRVELNIQ